MAPPQETPENEEEETMTTEDRLKSTLWYHLGTYVDHICLSLSTTTTTSSSNPAISPSAAATSAVPSGGLNATPHFIGALTEMVYAQVEGVASDVEGFARHAGRTNVTVEDVMLIARRNDGLKALLKTVPKA